MKNAGMEPNRWSTCPHRLPGALNIHLSSEISFNVDDSVLMDLTSIVVILSSGKTGLGSLPPMTFLADIANSSRSRHAQRCEVSITRNASAHAR